MDINNTINSAGGIKGMPSQFKTVGLENKTIENKVTDDVTISGSVNEPAVGIVNKVRSGESPEKSEKTAATGAQGVPGPSGAAVESILGAIAKGGVKFLQQRGFHVPLFMDKFKKITPEKAARVINKGSAGDRQKLRVKTPGHEPMPILDSGDVQELSVFSGGTSPLTIPGSDKARFLREALQNGGVTFQGPGSSKLDSYGAYNYLTTGWQVPGHDASPVDMVREGVPILKLTPGKMEDLHQVQVELKDAWKAFNGLKQEGREVLDMVGKPVKGSSFTQRAQIFNSMTGEYGRVDQAKVFYQAVSDSVQKDEKFTDVAGYFQDMQKATQEGAVGSMGILKAFNYARANLQGKPILEKAFVDFLVGIGDVNESVDALQLSTQPVGDESYFDRRDAIKLLSDECRDTAADSYRLVRENLMPGETIMEGVSEYAEMFREVKNSPEAYFSGAQRDTPRVFKYLRKDLKGQPEKQKAFRELYKAGGTFVRASQNMHLLEQPAGDADYSTRMNIMSKICRFRTQEQTVEDYTYLQAQGKDFKETGKIYTDMLTQLGYHNSSLAIDGIKFVRSDMWNDKAKIGSFTGILSGCKGIDSAKDVYSQIQKPVDGESYDSRHKAAMSLLGSLPSLVYRVEDVFRKDYQAIQDTLLPGETLEDAAEQLSVIRGASEPDYSYNSGDGTREAFVKLKTSSNMSKELLDCYVKWAKELKSTDVASEAVALLEKPVKGENMETREEVLSGLLEVHKGEKNAGADGVADYKTLTAHCGLTEDLNGAADRFAMLSKTLNGRENPESVRDAYTFVGEKLSDGTFDEATPSEATNQLVQALLICDSLSDAKEYVQNQNKPEENGDTVEVGDGFVIIGGVKLPISDD